MHILALGHRMSMHANANTPEVAKASQYVSYVPWLPDVAHTADKTYRLK